MALTYVFPVSSAGSRTYELLAKNLNSTAGVGIDDTQLTALYVPFDGAGDMP